MGAHILNSGKLSGKPGKEEKYRQAMMEECEHLLTLSNRVLVLTKLDEGHLELHQEEVPLRPLLDDCQNFSENQQKGRIYDRLSSL